MGGGILPAGGVIDKKMGEVPGEEVRMDGVLGGTGVESGLGGIFIFLLHGKNRSAV